ncbi:uncharacterized protein LOC131224947 [Magnolia sinica]|uniref:uncharacterized protein LOC131224947 n=1 Tax=Magnolia sinica TaxID=86752 RepID=UPI00265833CF|nr:uncharacterized protein LOC131224947 [Magnolia sinica]
MAKVTYDVVNHLKGIPAWLSIYDMLKISEDYRKRLIQVLSNHNVRETLLVEMENEERKEQEDCMPVVSFSDDDLACDAGHNRSLMIIGYIREKEVKRIMLDIGSVVNLLLLTMLNKLGYRRSDLHPSGIIIQGFNQDGQRALGKIMITLEIGDLITDIFYHVNSAVTTYNLLLGKPWIHQYGIVPSTLHQCFKYCMNGIQYKVMADARPYTEAEAFFADASYYDGFARREEKKNEKGKALKNAHVKVIKGESEKARSSKTSKAKKFYFVPRHLRQPGQPPLTLLSPEQFKILQSNYTVPLSYAKRSKPFPAIPGKFHVVDNAKYPEPIEFYASSEEKMEARAENNMYHGKLTSCDLEKYSPARRRMMKRMGFNNEEPTGLNHGKGIQVPIGVSQKKRERFQGLGTESSVNMVTVDQVSEADLEVVKYPETALKQIENGGQPTINSLQEINLGTVKELRNTFISVGLPKQEIEEYTRLLKENKDVFAWAYVKCQA